VRPNEQEVEWHAAQSGGDYDKPPQADEQDTGKLSGLARIGPIDEWH